MNSGRTSACAPSGPTTSRSPGGSRHTPAMCCSPRLSGLPFTRAPFPRPGNDCNFKNGLAAFITCLTPELAAELTRVAEEFLIRLHIRDEPPDWQPPSKILDGLDLPGPDLASLDLSEIHKLARADGASAAAIARRVGTTSDAIQALLLDHPAPADPAGGARRRRARYDISREQLRDLCHGQGLSFTEIGQRTGYKQERHSGSRPRLRDPHQHLPGRHAAPGTRRCRGLKIGRASCRE